MKPLRFCRLLPAALLLTCSCAHLQTGQGTEAQLKARATAYWQHRIKGELDEAYAFELPAMREDMSITQYARGLSEGIRLRKATIQRVALDGDRGGIVFMEFTFGLPGMHTPRGGIPMKANDYWELYDGIWYHAQKPPSRIKPTGLGPEER